MRLENSIATSTGRSATRPNRVPMVTPVEITPYRRAASRIALTILWPGRDMVVTFEN